MSILNINKIEKGVKGIEKAAIMMLSMPEEVASEVFSLLNVDEIRELSATMVNLGTVKSDTVESTFKEFVKELSSTGSLIGTLESTERLLSKAFSSDQAEKIMEEIRGPAGRTLWEKLNNVNEELLASFLKNEYPQTVALVLSKIKSLHSAKILSLLPESFSIEVVMRMLKMESVRKDIMESVENTLRNEFMNNLTRGSKRNTHEMVAEIFNNFDRSNEVKFLKLLEEKSTESAEAVRSLMFTFDDLENLDNAGIQILIRNVDKTKLVMALKGSSTIVKDLFFNNMSERAAKLMEEDIKQLGMVRLRDVEDAQSSIVSVAKDLSAQNIIIISSGKDDGDTYI
ncbi:MAG: flagellar motor switch protein FliG [Candidatus Puniceispirillum sp.]|nr:flagellar motor switch protein FliG [Candidatus Pelagibacter sp.]MBA4282872.1 flagellar motor switch protein FliG [Candidatus Puniceispirillum sp.]